MGKVKTLDKNIDKDIELCRTTNERVSEHTVSLLMENHIPFTKNWKKVPFFLRERYRGAEQIFIIRTNKNRYGQARRTIDQLDSMYKRRLVVSNY